MATTYFCAHCDREFVPEEDEARPRCPHCMRRGGVEPVRRAEPSASRGRWMVVAALVVAAAGIGYGVYRANTVTLEDTPPLRPLAPKELAAYFERDQIQVGAYQAMLVLPAGAADWPDDPAALASRLSNETARWPLEGPLPREVRTVGALLAELESSDARVKVYPLELAAAMTSLLRSQGRRAMVAEAWKLEDTGSPPDPSGLFGYFVTAVYDDENAAEPSSFVDPWGKGRVDEASVRVLRDTEVIAAALGTESARIFARSGDGAKALPLVQTALELDPPSPMLRSVNATILIESGGLPQALEELESARQLRPDGPRQLNLVQLLLAQAAFLRMNGEPSAAQTQFDEAQRIVTDVLARWPRYGRAHVMLATIHLGLGDPDRALVELQAAEQMTPDSPTLWTIWAQHDLERDDPIAAAQKMKRALALDPDNWQLLIQAARVFAEAGDDELASETASAAVARLPNDKRAEAQKFLDEMLDAPSAPSAPGATAGGLQLQAPTVGAPPVPAPDGAPEPGLMLGDPSNLKLRDPDQQLQLDLDP